MRRTATTILALASGLCLSGCATVFGGRVQTEMLIANHTGQPLTVAFDQTDDNTGAATTDVDLTVPADGTVRFSGKQGDTVVITAGDQPPLTLVFAKRSQTVKVSESGGQTSIDIYRGYTDPEK